MNNSYKKINIQKSPYCSIGYIHINLSGSQWDGTAILIKPNLILTLASLVYKIRYKQN
jgi:V8-like Glu-specific endopeptidase